MVVLVLSIYAYAGIGGSRPMEQWKKAFQIAAVYIGTIVGAGFATGKEIIEFFSQYGFIGLFGIFISGYLFIFFGIKMMVIAVRINAKSYEQLNNYLFGPFSKLLNIFMLIMLIGVTSVMFSGAGAVFEEHFFIPKFYGVILTIVLACLVMILGTKGIVYVNSFVVPVMIGFCFFLALHAVTLPSFLDQLFQKPISERPFIGLISPFTYTAFNLALAQAVLVPLASEIKDERVIKRGGMIGGILLTIILLANHTILIMLPNFHIYEIPMAVMMQKLASYLYVAYIFIIYSEIFTSIIGNSYGIEKQLQNYINIHRKWLYGIIFFLAFIISQIEYGKLLSFLYPLFGYISIIFILLLWRKSYDL
jgi:uncharacterized membrane protein YkvI